MDVTPELTFVALDADEQVIVASDTIEGAEAAHEAASEGDEPSGGVGDVVASLAESGEPLSGAFYTGDQVCAALSMGRADSVDQDQGPSCSLPPARSTR